VCLGSAIRELRPPLRVNNGGICRGSFLAEEHWLLEHHLGFATKAGGVFRYPVSAGDCNLGHSLARGLPINIRVSSE
jgi:hypothetical protein